MAAVRKKRKMTRRAKKAVRSISQKMERNTPVIERKMPTGCRPDPAIVRAAAKYQEALERLARE